MRSIRQQDFAVLIISDEYLRSVACLYEVLQLMKDENWDQRVMYIVSDNARGIFDTTKQLEYIRYWQKQEKELSDHLKEFDPSIITAQAEELKRKREITQNVGQFMSKVKRVNNPSMESAIDAVISRVKGNGDCLPKTENIKAIDEDEDNIELEGIEVPSKLRDG